MGRILDLIEREGRGNYRCYKTRKSTVETENDGLVDYDDRYPQVRNSSTVAETDKRRCPSVRIGDRDISNAGVCEPLFRYFLDGSRRVYKVDDMGIGSGVYPVVAGQIIVGCCERRDRDTFKRSMLTRKMVLALPTNFNTDDDPNLPRLYADKINDELSRLCNPVAGGLKIDEIILYPTDALGSDEGGKNGLLNRAVARIQTLMTDTEQMMVDGLCGKNLLDDEAWLIKDGSLEYTRSERIDDTRWAQMKNNYSHVVGVSKQFNPDLLLDYERHKLSKTIASLRPFERTKVYRYEADRCGGEFAVWYLRLRRSDFRETNFSDVVKCEILISGEGEDISTELVDIISANIIREAFPVCYGKDTRWANHLYPVFLTETFCKANYVDTNVVLNLF